MNPKSVKSLLSDVHSCSGTDSSFLRASYMAYGVRPMAYGLRPTAYGPRPTDTAHPIAHSLWSVAHGLHARVKHAYTGVQSLSRHGGGSCTSAKRVCSRSSSSGAIAPPDAIEKTTMTTCVVGHGSDTYGRTNERSSSTIMSLFIRLFLPAGLAVHRQDRFFLR